MRALRVLREVTLWGFVLGLWVVTGMVVAASLSVAFDQRPVPEARLRRRHVARRWP